MSQLDEALSRAANKLDPEDHQLFSAIADSYLYLSEVIEDKQTTIAKLRKLMFGSKSEKYKDVVGSATGQQPDQQPESQDTAGEQPASKPTADTDDEDNDTAFTVAEDTPPEKKKRAPGHGRRSAADYTGGQQVTVKHPELEPGSSCPECDNGTLYEKTPKVVVKLVGQAPIDATVYRMQKLRCHLCGKTFTAPPPVEATGRKYDCTAVSMIALLRYGSGFPFNRLDRLQGNLEIPLAASTQWDVLSSVAPQFIPVHHELMRQAAQGDVVYNDDTTVKILELLKANKQLSEGERSGIFTSGIVSTTADYQIALYFSGRQHAGENLGDILKQRGVELEEPIQMCDALSRNLPKEMAVILSNCMSHARREFVDIYDRFSNECEYVLNAMKHVYKIDGIARKQKMSPQERLEFHQQRSQSTMDDLHSWMQRQFDEKLVEPNSALGGAITYMLKRWDRFTLFLRKAGAPLDNNICERALKRAIMHRKNSLFYKTLNGAQLGDMFMSFIHTCELCQANAFDYLTQLQRNNEQVLQHPDQWMPWNYQQTLAAIPAAA